MSSLDTVNLKLGGRLQALADAYLANKLRTAASIALEIGGELNAEAEGTDGLLAEDPEDDSWMVAGAAEPTPAPIVKAPSPRNLEACSRGAHSFPAAPDSRGWWECTSCGFVSVTGPAR